MEKQNQLGCNRRDFLKAAGIGAAALAMPGLIRNASAAPVSGILQEVITTDVLIIGGGIAGTFAAIKAAKAGADVTLVDKGTVGRSGLSPFFGAYSKFDKSGDISREEFIERVSATGSYLVRQDYLDMFMDDSADIAEEFLSWGVGEDLSHVGGHGSKYRGQVLKSGVRLVERTMITELIKKNGKIAGAIGFPMEEDKAVVIKAKAVILCSGSGALKTPGFPCNSITHDGDAMSYRIGAEITGKEFEDFHWTHWENPADMHGNWESVLFESVRPSAYTGAGPDGGPSTISLKAHNGEVPTLMSDLMPGGGDRGSGERPSGAGRGEGMGERPADAPRNGESDAMPGGGNVGRLMPGTRDASLPIAWGATAGMAAHKCEGIFPKGDKCSSSVPGLFAAGDALFTAGAAYSGGVGSSSSGSAVQGARAGRYAAEYAKENKQQKLSDAELAQSKAGLFAPRTSEKGYSPIWVTQVLQGIMVPYYVLAVKKQSRLQAALSNVQFLREQFAPKLLANDTHQLRLAHETRNMLLNSEMKLRASLMRTESRGSHYREDYPDQDNKNWLAWIIITNGGDKMKLEKRAVPDAWKP